MSEWTFFTIESIFRSQQIIDSIEKPIIEFPTLVYICTMYPPVLQDKAQFSMRKIRLFLVQCTSYPPMLQDEAPFLADWASCPGPPQLLLAVLTSVREAGTPVSSLQSCLLSGPCLYYFLKGLCHEILTPIVCLQTTNLGPL